MRSQPPRSVSIWVIPGAMTVIAMSSPSSRPRRSDLDHDLHVCRLAVERLFPLVERDPSAHHALQPRAVGFGKCGCSCLVMAAVGVNRADDCFVLEDHSPV